MQNQRTSSSWVPQMKRHLRKDRMFLASITGFVFFFSGIVRAEPNVPSYPTMWKLENQTKSSVVLSCEGRAKGLSSPITLASRTLEPQGSESHYWKGWHNDGLGLNAADWKCLVKSKSTHNQIESTFRTFDGQDSLIVIRETSDQLELLRLDLVKSHSAQGRQLQPSGKKQ